MKNVLIILFVCVVVALGQIPWTTRARIKHHTEFFSQVMQETVYEIEKRGFSSLKLLNITQDLDERMYQWRVNGTANYTNGFLVSIQKIDVTAMTQFVGVPTVDGVRTPRATVRGRLNFRDAKLGYDVTFLEVNGTEHKFTGDYTHTLIHWLISIQKNLVTNKVTVLLTTETSGNLGTMVYRPATNITEVISREYSPLRNEPGIRTWTTVLQPIIMDVIKNKVPFPKVCFSHC